MTRRGGGGSLGVPTDPHQTLLVLAPHTWPPDHVDLCELDPEGSETHTLGQVPTGQVVVGEEILFGDIF